MASDYSKEVILDLIRDGCGTRVGLQIQTGFTDRQIRKGINDLRKDGHAIVNFGDGRGYFITTSASEFEDWKRLFLSRAYDELKTARIMERSFAND